MPDLGDRKINSITDRDIAALHAKIVGRGSRIAANRTVRNLGAILSRSIERGERAEPNPARGLQENVQRAKARALFCRRRSRRGFARRSTAKPIDRR